MSSSISNYLIAPGGSGWTFPIVTYWYIFGVKKNKIQRNDARFIIHMLVEKSGYNVEG